MRGFFYPESVAVVGVSSSPTNLGQIIINNLVNFGFKGKIYPVGPKGGRLGDLEIKESIAKIPAPTVDLAILLTPAAAVPELLDECGEKGVRRVIVSSGGFSELGEERLSLENKVLETLKKWKMRMIGPNCVGTINLETGLCLPFVPMLRNIKKGGISILTQSGGVGFEYLQICCDEGLGINKFVSVGNKLDVGENELLEYLIEDPLTTTVFLYLEDIKDGRNLMKIAYSSPKPVVVQKSNVSQASFRVGRSHTAALLNDDRVVKAALKQAGIIRVRDSHEATLALKAFQMPPLRGNNLAIITRSGGHAVVAADACSEFNFHLPELPSKLLEEVQKEMRAGVIKLQNPLDLGDTFNPSLHPKFVEIALREENIDGAVFIASGNIGSGDEVKGVLQDLVRVAFEVGKPVALCYCAYFPEAGLSFLGTLKMLVPLYTSPRDALKGLAMARDFFARQKSRAPASVYGVCQVS